MTGIPATTVRNHSQTGATVDSAQASGATSVPEYGWAQQKAPTTAPYLAPAITRSIEPIAAHTRILDIGCGNGFFVGPFAQRCQVVGIDPSEEGIAIARREFPGARWERIAAVPEILELLNTDPFDFVLSVEVIEHVYLPRLWAQACFNALKPGGTLVATTPYHGYLKNLTLSLTDSWDAHFGPLWDGGHIKFWSKRTLRQLLAEAGFTDIRFVGRGRIPWLWKSMVVVAKRP